MINEECFLDGDAVHIAPGDVAPDPELAWLEAPPPRFRLGGVDALGDVNTLGKLAVLEEGLWIPSRDGSHEDAWAELHSDRASQFWIGSPTVRPEVSSYTWMVAMSSA